MKPYFTRFRHLPLSCLLAFLLLSGCGMNASGEHTVSMDQDWFKNEINGRTIEYRNWVIKIGEKEIPIEKKQSTIKYQVSAAGKLDIFVNGEQVHDE